LGLLSNTSDYEVLAKDLQDRLATEIKQIPGANVMQALAAEQAHKDALDTVMLMMIRIQARNKCEVLRRKLLKAINYGGPLSVLILDKLRIDTTVVTDSRFTPAKCDARSAHFQAVISALF
jgi:hypothetical protein